MPVTGTISESNSAPIGQVGGSLNSGSLSGLSVIGIARAGRFTGGIGTALSGTYGSLTVQANGSYVYTLDNTDPDTNLLASGDAAHDRFVVTYSLGGVVQTIELDFTVNGIDDIGQIDTVTTSTTIVATDLMIGATDHLVVTGARALFESYSLSGPVTVANYGSINLIRASESYFGDAVSLPSSTITFNNFGRVTVRSASGQSQVTGLIGSGTNFGVISSSNAAPASGASFTFRAVGWDSGSSVNNGLVEAISNAEAFGVWTHSGVNFTNNGTILAIGGSSDDPLGIIGYRSGGSVGSHIVNTGTIWARATNSGQPSVGLSFFPSSTNPYSPMWITNSGTIVAETAIMAIEGYNVATHLANSGNIEGAIRLDGGVNIVSNLAGGSIFGSIYLGRENDLLINAGIITGSIYLAARGDLYRAIGDGSVSGTVFGEDGADALIGASAADRLDGGLGSDWIQGGSGADILTGGAGGDVFAYSSVADSTAAIRDTITDFLTGSDRIDISALGPATISLTAMGGQTILSATTADGTLNVAITGSIALGDIVTAAPGSSQNGTGDADVLVARVAGSSLNGLASSDTLIGSAGNDLIDGGTGADSMFGGAGDDIYFVDEDADRVSELVGEGIDEVRSTVSYSLQANAENLTLLGSIAEVASGNDLDNVIIGNSIYNLIYPGAGNDRIIPGGGGDEIFLASGNDVIVYQAVSDSTGANIDRIHTYDVSLLTLDLTAFTILSFTVDEFYNYWSNHYTTITAHTAGGDITIRIDGRASVDQFLFNLQPGAGLVINGVAGNDLLAGRSGDDIMAGGAGDDLLQGRLGSDQLNGGAGADRLEGGEDNDFLIGGEGNDRIDGGLGNGDTVILAGNYADFRITTGVIIDGVTYVTIEGLGTQAGQGTDTLLNVEYLQFLDRQVHLGSGSNSRPVLGQPAMADQTALDGQAYSYQIPATSFIDVDLGDVLTFRVTQANGSPLPDWLSFNSATRTFTGTPPIEAIGTVLEVRVFASDNNPNDTGYEISDSFVLTINQAPGADVNGTSGNDQLFGTFRNETLAGFDGDDLLTGSAGADVMHGGSGIDTVDYSGASGPVTLSLDAGTASGGDIGSDLLYAIEGAIGSAYGDDLTGSNGNDFLSGNLGDDTIHGLDGSDQLFGEAGSDTLYGEGAVDLLSGGAGADFLYGGSGNDALWSANPSLPLFPSQQPFYWVDPLFDRSSEADLLDGGDGDDSLFAGYGDTVTGGADTGFGDTLYISFMGASAGITADFNQASQTIGGGSISGIENTAAIEGSDFDDDLTARAVAPGFNGYTTLAGMGGNDRLVANARTTVMDGGIGNDTIDTRGSLTLQTVSGGDGNDRLIFNASGSGGSVSGGTGLDVLVIDNTNAASFISLSGLEGLELVDATLALSNSQFTSGFASNSSVTGAGRLIVGMLPGDLFFATQMTFAATVGLSVNGSAAGDVIKGPLGAASIVSGEGGADQIRTGNLADTIIGGDGNDKIMGMGGADSLLGGAGADQFRYLFATDSGLGGQADQIFDFTNGEDKLDFRALDANPVLAGRQALGFIGTAAFATDGTAQLRYVDVGGDTRIEIDLNGDGAADMHVLLAGHAGQGLAGTDFLF